MAQAKERKLIVIALFLIVVTPTVSIAAGMRTDQMMWKCNGTGGNEIDKAFGKMRCAGYMDGVMDFQAIIIKPFPRAKFFCVPKTGISIDQAMRIFVKWAENHPKDLHVSARVSVLLSLREAFPCN